ncbi:MAG: DUF167 domain-containing protein [Deltaproteobacteria bacterium]|jgi:uncharacterized protein (TIGR00251 family)|nr:DUF167 domain-containing protein [Deltaproteobacteria bacterium]
MARGPSDAKKDPKAKAVRLNVKVCPGSSRDSFSGTFDGDPKSEIKINLAAPPVDGKANRALVRFLAEKMGLRNSDVTIERGLSSRKKTVKMEGADEAAVMETLKSLMAGEGGKAPGGKGEDG